MKNLFTLFSFLTVGLLSFAQPTWQVGNTTLTEYDLVTGVQVPWEILWGADDHIWATERRGRVLRIEPETGNYEVVLDLIGTIPSNGNGEPGMLGMVQHPDWENNPYIYVVYNYQQGGTRERLSRFEWNGTQLVNEEYILNNLPGWFIHNGSRLVVLEDNTLLMSTGDIGDGGESSQDLDDLNGKVLRMNLDGTVPADNPYPGSLVYSWGHRNIQGLCQGPNGIIYASEHGQSNDDEFNIIEPSRNYGWPEVEGMCDGFEQADCEALNVREPLLTWSPCIAVNGIEYYTHPAIPEWQNSVLLSVLGGLSGIYERLSVLHMSADGMSVESEDQYFSEFNQRVRDICVNPHNGAVYVALNGPQYPGQGPNIIKEFVNEDFVSVEENNAINTQNIEVFPNPASSQINFNFTEEFVGSNYKIYGFDSKLVEEKPVNSQKVVLDIENWAPGNYYLTSTTNKGTVTRTFVVL